jgi:Domain of unknown function (DUF4440)
VARNASIGADLEGVERRRLAALVGGDMVFARSLHADDYELITPGGGQLSKEEYLGDLESGAMRYEVFEPASPVRTHVVGNSGIVRYQVQIRVRFGEDVDTGLFWHTDYYELRDGRWQAVWSHATRIRQAEPDS